MPSRSERSPDLVPDAGILSVTVVHESSRSYGVKLAQRNRNNSSNRSIGSNGSNGSIGNRSNGFVGGGSSTNNAETSLVIDTLVHPSHGLLQGSPLAEGDVLKTINNRPATMVLAEDPIDDGHWELDWGSSETFRDGAPVTFVLEKQSARGNGSNSSSSSGSSRSSSSDGNSSDGNGDCEDKDEDDEDEDDDDDECRSAVVRAVCRLPASNSRAMRNGQRNVGGADNAVRSEWLKKIGLGFHRVVVEENSNERDANEIDSDNDNDNDNGNNNENKNENENATAWDSGSDSSDGNEMHRATEELEKANDSDTDTVSTASSTVPVVPSTASLDAESSVDVDVDVDVDSVTQSEESPSSSSSPSPSFFSYLQIDKIDPNGLLAHSVLNQGDIVLAINGIPICAAADAPTAEDANDLLLHRAIDNSNGNGNGNGREYKNTTLVDIVALNPKKLWEVRNKNHQAQSQQQLLRRRRRRRQRQWMRAKAKKAGVALKGGAMIGVGMVVHPLGVILMAGGVSVLGTEFETPNRMVRSARDSFAQWANSGSESGSASGTPSTDRSPGESTGREEEQVLFSNESSGTNESNARLGQHASTQSLSPTVSGDVPIVLARSKSLTSLRSWSSVISATSGDPLSPTTSSQTSRTQRAADNVKRIGKRFVLPFLDRLAGDRKADSACAGASPNDDPRSQQQQQQQHRDDEEQTTVVGAEAVDNGATTNASATSNVDTKDASGVETRQQWPIKHE